MTTAPPGAICIGADVDTVVLDPGDDEIALKCLAFGILDPSPLVVILVTRGGDNVTLPEEQGRRPYPLELDQIQVALPFVVSGVTDPDGTPYDDDELGLKANLAYLKANVWRPTGTATRACRIDEYGGGTLTANIQSVGVQPVKKSRGYWSGVWTVNVPLGEFT